MYFRFFILYSEEKIRCSAADDPFGVSLSIVYHFFPLG